MLNFKTISREFIKLNFSQFQNLVKNWKYCDWKEDNFLYELPKKWEFSLAVLVNNNLAGFCIASNKIKDVYYIHLFFVSNAYRNQDLGTKLIEEAKGISKNNKINRIELRCPESNSGALSFYKKMGFSISERIKDEVSGPESDYYLTLNF